MPIRVLIYGGDTRTQAEYLRRVESRLRSPRNGLVKAANAAAGVWEKNFRRGGSMVGGWAQLAEATKQTRQRQGFPPGPVLIRYGALKAVVTEGFMSARGPASWSRRDPYSTQNTRARLSISKDVATLSAHGWKVANQYGHPNRSGRAIPPRPFWFVDRTVMAASKSAVEKWIADEVLAGPRGSAPASGGRIASPGRSMYGGFGSSLPPAFRKW